MSHNESLPAMDAYLLINQWDEGKRWCYNLRIRKQIINIFFVSILSITLHIRYLHVLLLIYKTQIHAFLSNNVSFLLHSSINSCKNGEGRPWFTHEKRLGATSIEKIPKISASGKNFLYPSSSREGSTNRCWTVRSENIQLSNFSYEVLPLVILLHLQTVHSDCKTNVWS